MLRGEQRTKPSVAAPAVRKRPPVREDVEREGIGSPMQTAEDLVATPPRDSTTFVSPPVPDSGADHHDDIPEAEREIVFSAADLAVTYSGTVAIEDVDLEIGAHEITALDRPVGVRQEHVHPLLQPHERPHRRGRGARHAARTTAPTSTAPKVDPVEVRRRIGMVFQKPNPFPKSIFDNIAFGPRLNGTKRGLDEVVEARADAGRAVGRGQGQAQGERVRALGWSAAAAVHRALHRRRARRDPHGRAVLRARPDRDRARSRTSWRS